jgi:Trypsin
MSRIRVRSLAAIAGTSLLACGVVLGGVAPASAQHSAARPPEVLKAALDVLAGEGKAGNAQYWYIDPAIGKVAISILQGLPDPVTQAFLATALPGETVVSTVSAPIVPMVGRVPAGRVATPSLAGGTVYAGQSIEMTWGTDQGAVCTSGFNQQDTDGYPRTLTAGHCGNGVLGNSWHISGGDTFGYVKESHFAGADWSSIGLNKDPAWHFPWEVKQAGGLPNQPINSYAQAYVGENLCMTGQTSGTKCGKVTATNVTVNYVPAGAVYGLTQTTIPSGPGDSGGPVYNGSIGVGLVSGGPQGGGAPMFAYPAQCDPGRPWVCS